LNLYLYDSGRLSVNEDIRRVTSNLTNDATYSSLYSLYPDFSTRTLTGGADAASSYNTSGNFIVFAYATTDTAGVTTVNRLVGYYLNPNAAGIGPLQRFDVTFNKVIMGNTTNSAASPPVYTMCDLLNSSLVNQPSSAINNNPILMPIVQGTSGGCLFYRPPKIGQTSDSAMIMGQITEITHKLGSVRQAIHTFQLTVSPRN
jgi:hypothetical protein